MDLIISQAELDQNEPDHGIMFCEDCRKEHQIEYASPFDTFPSIGFYRCRGESYLYSINGKRID